MANQNWGLYVKGDKAWYQHQDDNAVCEPASVIIQWGNSVWVYVSGDIQNLAACKVKPYE